MPWPAAQRRTSSQRTARPAGSRSSTRRAASAATPARTACKSENDVPARRQPDLREVRGRGTVSADAARVPGHALQPVRGRALRHGLPDRAPCTAVPTGSSTSTRRVASAARPASPPARTTRSSSIRTTTPPRSATSARTVSTSGSSRPASWSVPTEAILVGDLNDPTSARRSQSCSASPSRSGGPRRRRAPSCSTRARTRPRSTRSPRAGPPGGLFLWSEQPAGPGQVVAGHPQGGTNVGRRAPVLRRAPHARRGTGGSACTRGPRASPPARTSWPPLLVAARPRPRDQRAVALGRTARGGRLPRGHRRAADRGPRAPAAVPVHFHQAAAAQLARPRRLHHRRLRRRARGRTSRRRSPAPTAVPLRLAVVGVPLAVAHGRLHRAISSPRPRPAICGRARCCRRTSPVQAVLAGAAALVPFAARLEPGGGAAARSRRSRPRRSHTSPSSPARSR